MKKHIILSIIAALALTGCRTKKPGVSAAEMNAGLSASNRVGNVIGDGKQISSMMDADSVIGDFKEVAKYAAEHNTEMSLTAVGHGASKQPNVQRESKATEKLTNSLASAIKAAKSGGSDPQALAKFGADLVGGLVELSEEAANPPASDDTSLLGFDLKVGPGANLAGIAVAETMARTRIETVKAARSTYNRVTTTDTQESNTPAGIEAITGAMVELRKLSDGAASSPPVVKPGDPAGATTGAGDSPASGPGASEPSDMTPAERLEAWYPSANHTDKPGFAPVETALWKPAGEKTGKLAIHLPHSKLGRIIKCTVDDEASGVGQTGNGGRPLHRFSKPGGSCSGVVTVVSETGTWTAKNAKPAERANLDFKLSKPVSELPAVTPAATNSTGVATAPGGVTSPAGRVNLDQLRITDGAITIPAGLSWQRVVWSETGYTTGGKSSVLSGAGNSLSGPVSVVMPSGWRNLRSEPAGTNKGHQLVWLDKVASDGRMLEFWVNPSGPRIGNVGEVWLSGASFWKSAGYNIKMGSSSNGSRAYVVR